jgi:hypothetical protein
MPIGILLARLRSGCRASSIKVSGPPTSLDVPFTDSADRIDYWRKTDLSTSMSRVKFISSRWPQLTNRPVSCAVQARLAGEASRRDLRKLFLFETEDNAAIHLALLEAAEHVIDGFQRQSLNGRLHFACSSKCK